VLKGTKGTKVRKAFGQGLRSTGFPFWTGVEVMIQSVPLCFAVTEVTRPHAVHVRAAVPSSTRKGMKRPQ